MEPALIECEDSELSKKCEDEVSEELSAVSQDTTKAGVWRPTDTFSALETLATEQMIGKFLLDVFGGNDFLTRATHRLGLRG